MSDWIEKVYRDTKKTLRELKELRAERDTLLEALENTLEQINELKGPLFDAIIDSGAMDTIMEALKGK